MYTKGYKKVAMSSQKVAEDFYCEVCYYRTSKKYNFSKHCLTAKHTNVTNVTNSYMKVAESSNCFCCNKCSKKYKSRFGLWRHNKKCTIVSNLKKNDTYNAEVSNIIPTNLFLDILKGNNDLMKKMMEMTQSHLLTPTTTINGAVTNNNHNQQFNLNFFLNETCKDAMNIQEFIENIKVTFDDLMTIGNTGFVNGVSDIFLKQLKDLDVTKRPIHCTDSKRETIYLKEFDTWEKDDKDNVKLRDAIERLEKKNVVSLHQWCTDHPDSKVNNTPNNLLRDKIFMQTLQGDDKTRGKVIKNIAKEVAI